MNPTFLILVILSVFHVMVPSVYYLFMKRIAEKKPWNLSFNESYEPTVTIIVATYNEARNILRKLQNIEELDYPKDKLEVIIVDSASTDGTADLARAHINAPTHASSFRTLILEETERRGKAQALNHALEYASSEIIATSDADCLWPQYSMRNAVKYMSNPQVAAVCGQEALINPNNSSATRTESQYRGLFNYIRVGESKIHSTIVFEGALALYRRGLLKRFDEPCDDSGSALDLVQKGYRTIMAPDIYFFNPPPSKWSEKLAKKTRRAQHLVEIWHRCLSLDLKRKLELNSWISRVNVFLYIINPFLFPVFMITLILLLIEYPAVLLGIPLILLIPKGRDFLLLYFTNYLFLLQAIFMEALGKKQVVWKK